MCGNAELKVHSVFRLSRRGKFLEAVTLGRGQNASDDVACAYCHIDVWHSKSEDFIIFGDNDRTPNIYHTALEGVLLMLLF